MKTTTDEPQPIDLHYRRRSTPTEEGAVIKRRISWEQLWALRPDLRPANDNRRAD